MPTSLRSSPDREQSFSWREYWFLLALFAVALGIRLLYLDQIRSNPFFEHPRLDALFHDRWAQSIAGGNVLGDAVFFRAPLYAYFLGLLYAVFGHDYMVPRIAQHMIGAGSVLMVYLLSRRYQNHAVSVFATLLVLFYPVLIYFEGELLFETLLIFLSLVWLFILSMASEQPTKRRWFLVGFLLGLVCITRPTMIAVGAPIIAYLFWSVQTAWDPRKLLNILATTAIGFCVVVLPIGVRNYLVGQDFVLISSQGGVNFHIGNNPLADGMSSSLPEGMGTSWENRDATFFMEKELGHRPSPSEESWFWYTRAFKFIADQPVEFARLLLKKSFLFWNHLEIPNNQDYYSFKAHSTLLDKNPLTFGLVAPFGLLGLVFGWRDKNPRVLSLFVLLYCAVTVLFFVCDRFRLPVVPVICILAARATCEAFNDFKLKNYRRILVQSTVFLFLFGIVNSDLYSLERSNPAREYFALGLVDLEKKEWDNASSNFKKAFEVQPDLPNLRIGLAVAELMKGNSGNAEQELRQELEQAPGSFLAVLYLSHIYLQKRSIDSAVFFAERAVLAKPYIPWGYVALAKAYIMKGAGGTADSVLERGARICDTREYLYGSYLIAGIRSGQGRIEEAERIYRAIIKQLSFFSQPVYEPEFGFSLEQKIGERLETLNGKAWYGLGHVFLARGMIDSAIECFKVSTSLSSDLSDAWADLGIALLRTNHLSEAESALDKALNLDSENHLYWFNYGIVMAHSRKFLEAERAFEMSIKVRPDFSPAKEILNRTRKLQGSRRNVGSYKSQSRKED